MSAREYAVITGASSGIGAASATLLAENGYYVIAGARRRERLDALAASNENIEAVELDVTDQSSVDALASQLRGKPVAVLINCAGGLASTILLTPTLLECCKMPRTSSTP